MGGFLKIIFFIIFLLNVAYANAAPKLYYEKGVAEDKVKLQLIIKEKKKEKSKTNYRYDYYIWF